MLIGTCPIKIIRDPEMTVCLVGQRYLETAVKTYSTKWKREILGHARDVMSTDLVSNYRKMQSSDKDSGDMDKHTAQPKTDRLKA